MFKKLKKEGKEIYSKKEGGKKVKKITVKEL